MFDTHPWSRPFDKGSLEEGKFVIRKPYEETGPFLDDVTYDWRIQDYVNALVSSGFSILRMEEFHSIPEDLPNHNYLSDMTGTKILVRLCRSASASYAESPVDKKNSIKTEKRMKNERLS